MSSQTRSFGRDASPGSTVTPSELERGRSATRQFLSDETAESFTTTPTENGRLAVPPLSTGTRSRRSSRANDAQLAPSPSHPYLDVSTFGCDHHSPRPSAAPSVSSLSHKSIAFSQQDTIELSIIDRQRSTPQTIDQHADMWLEYNMMADKEDREFVKTANENLNTLLIFAGIFAAINASFILETFKSLKADPQDITNQLLVAQINHKDSNSSVSLPSADDFHPSYRDIRTNLAFFSSLCTSLAGSFLAVIGKQWLSNYENEGSLKPPAERARERQRKFEGREKYHLQGVVESLPTLLQAALLVFLAGLADLLWPLAKSVSICVIFFLCLIFTAWVSLTVIATFFPRFPYQTRLSIVLRRVVLPPQNKEAARTAVQTFAISVRIIGQMLKNTIHSDTTRLDILADCFDTIPPDADIKELGDIMVQFHFRPLQVTAVEPWDTLKTSMIHEEFRSSGMLRIVRGLIKHKGSLEPDVREAILSRVYLLSWQTELDDDCAQPVADIIASDVDWMEAMRVDIATDPAWEAPLERHRRRNLELKLADRLCGRLVENKFQETSRPCLTHFFKCLPENYSRDPAITRILNRLAKFYESSDGNADIGILGDVMMEFCLSRSLRPGEKEAFKSDLPPPQTTIQPYDEEFRSAPMLRLIGVLLLRYNMTLEVRNAILLRIWRSSRQEGVKPEVAETMASIIAQHLVQVEDLVKTDMNLSWTVSFDQSQRRHLGVHLASCLCTRLVEGKLDKFTSASCLSLLFCCLPDHYATDPTFNKLLSKLADFYEPLPKDDININVLASATTKFCLRALDDDGRRSLTRASGEVLAQGQTSHNEFHSVPMLRIIYTLLRHLILESDSHEKILSHVWHISQQKPTGPDHAEVITKIIALGVKKVDRLRRTTLSWRSSLTPDQYCNMSVALASQLVSELEKESLDGETTRSWMSLFCDSLDTRLLDHSGFSATLGELAGKLTSRLSALIEVDKTSIRLLAEKLMQIWLKPFVAGENALLQEAEGLRPIPIPAHEFLSVPMLKILYVLLCCSALHNEVRKCILSCIWRLSKMDVVDIEVAGMFAEIMALEAVELEKLRLSYAPSSWVRVSSAQQRNLGTPLEKRLNNRLETPVDEETSTAYFGLLCDFLPEDSSDNPAIPSIQQYITLPLATFYESLSPDDPSIAIMATRLSKLHFDRLRQIKRPALLPDSQDPPVPLPVDQELRSIPLLRIFLVLVRHRALPQDTRKTVLSHVWALSQEDAADNERIGLMAEIIAVEALEITEMLKSESSALLSSVQLRTLSVPLASQLLNTLVKESSDLETICARATLLFHCLPKSLSEETAAQVLDTQAAFIRFLVESCTDGLPIRPEFRLTPVLRIVSVLFASLRLEPEMIASTLNLIWDISCQDVMKPDTSGLLAEIIASKAAEVAKIRQIRSPSQPSKIGSLDAGQYRNIAPQLALLLCDLLVSGGLGKEDKPTLDLFWSCLPLNFTDDDAFTPIITKLAIFYESLSIGDIRIQSLADSITAFPVFTDEVGSPVVEDDQTTPALLSNYNELLSIPVLRIIAVLFQSSFLKKEKRMTVLSRIWLIACAKSLDEEQAEMVGRIAAMGAVEIEIMRKAPPAPKIPTNQILNKRSVSLALASNLCKRLAREYLGDEARASCLDLFYHCLPSKFNKDNLIELLDWLADGATFPTVPSKGLKFRATAVLQRSFTLSDDEKASSWPFVQESKLEGLDKGLLLEETRSVPKLRVAGSLFHGDSSGSPPHEIILFHLWAIFWSVSTELAKPRFVTDIVASGANEIVRNFMITGERDERYQQQERSAMLVSTLCGRLASGRLDLESEDSCLNLLFACLPQEHSAYKVLGDSIKPLGRFIKSRHHGCETDIPKLSSLRSGPLLKSTLLWLGWDKEDKHRQSILLNIWVLSQRYSLEPEMVNWVVEILSSHAGEVQAMRSRNPSTSTVRFHSNQISLGLRLASRLLSAMVGETLGKEEFKGRLELFMECVDEGIAEDPAFITLLGGLADFCESLPITDEKLEALGDMYTDVDEDLPLLLEKKLAERKSQGTVVAHDQIFEETPLFPLIRIYRVLMRSPTYSQPVARSNCIVDLWLYMARGDMKATTADILADAIVAGALETAQLLKQFPSLLSFGPQNYPRTSAAVVSRLNSKLKDEGLTDEVKLSISELLDIFVANSPVVP